MPKLLVKFRGKVLNEIPIRKSCLTIGRTDENDIVIDNLGVSRQHAKVFRQGDDFVLEDMGSRNGTILNDEIVERCKLQDKDRISIGKHDVVFLLYEGDGPIEEVAEIETDAPRHRDFSSLHPEETLKIAAPAKAKHHQSEGKAPENQGMPAKQHVGIKIIEGGEPEKEIIFHRLLIVAGKGPRIDIPIQGDYNKDIVFVISHRPSGYFISPPKCIPVKVNGADISDYIKLQDGDIIDAGETKMRFFMQ